MLPEIGYNGTIRYQSYTKCIRNVFEFAGLEGIRMSARDEFILEEKDGAYSVTNRSCISREYAALYYSIILLLQFLD